MIWIYTIGSVLIVSLASFMGALSLTISLEKLKKIMFVLISFAAGTLLGDTFLHIIPEMTEGQGWLRMHSFSVLAAILVFYMLEHFIRWHHSHHVDAELRHPVGMLNLVGDGLHNFMDGLVIGASYAAHPAIGVATTIAVLFHELPQEIGDFAILIHSGFTVRRALWFNFLSATLAVAGGAIAVWLGNDFTGAGPALLAFSAGGFIYIATVDLIPELHKEVNASRSLLQLLSLLAGMGLMWVLTMLE